MSTAERIKLFRTKRGLTQEQLATEVGFSRKTINSYELGLNLPSTTHLRILAAYFCTSPDYLLGINPVVSPGLQDVLRHCAYVQADCTICEYGANDHCLGHVNCLLEAAAEALAAKELA